MFAILDAHAGKEAVVASQRILPEALGSFLRGGLGVQTCILGAFDDKICQANKSCHRPLGKPPKCRSARHVSSC